MKNTIKKSNGITLIVLVITIIVLLILAGITIATLTGENGLLGRATQARDKTSISQIEEELILAYNDIMIDKMTSGNVKEVNTGEWTIKMIESGKTVIIEETDNANEYFVTIDSEDDLYVFNTTTKKISKYNKQFSSNWYDEYTYTTDDTNNTIVLTKYNGTDKVAYVGKSAKIGGKEYTTVLQGQKDGSGNITDTIFGDTAATKVKIQSGITEIGEGAFYNNSNLNSIIIPNGVTEIGNLAVHGNLENTKIVYIPQGVLSITNSAFNGCQSLKTVISGAKEMINASFANCSQIENVKFLEGVEIITNGAFSSYNNENNKLREIVFPQSMKIVRNSAFQNYTGLKKAVLPSGSEETGGSAFSGCSNLEELIIGTKLLTDGAFGNLPKLQKVTFLEGTETITYSAFANCPMITSVQFPNGIKNIIYGAFSNCQNLTQITIPDSIETINYGAFSVNDSLKTTLNTSSKVAKNYDWAGVKRIITNSTALEIGDVVTNYISNTALPTGTNWIYFGEDDEGHKLLTTSAPIENGFTLNRTAQNWLYYCMQEGDEDYEAHSSELTESNNIHLACSKYSGRVGTTAGTARSITLKDINKVVGFNESSLQFNNYTFIAGNTNDFGNNNVNYYYPSFLGASRSDYPYFAKAEETLNDNIVGTKQFLYNAYSYYKDGDDYKVYWQGTDKSWPREATTITNAQYMPLIVGNSNDLSYAVASRSVSVANYDAMFYVAGVGGGYVYSGNGYYCFYFCGSNSSYGFGGGNSSSVSVRPIIVLPSSVTLEK